MEALGKEEKKLKAELKADEVQLHLKTKEIIEKLTDGEAKALLEKKWILPICEEIGNLPRLVLEDLCKKIEVMAEKYADTYEDIEKEIAETEEALNKMLDNLVGNEKDMAGIREFRMFCSTQASPKFPKNSISTTERRSTRTRSTASSSRAAAFRSSRTLTAVRARSISRLCSMPSTRTRSCSRQPSEIQKNDL